MLLVLGADRDHHRCRALADHQRHARWRCPAARPGKARPACGRSSCRPTTRPGSARPAPARRTSGCWRCSRRCCSARPGSPSTCCCSAACRWPALPRSSRCAGSPWSPAVRVWAAASYALLPVAFGAISAGRLGSAVAFVLIPLIGMLAGRMFSQPPQARPASGVGHRPDGHRRHRVRPAAVADDRRGRRRWPAITLRRNGHRPCPQPGHRRAGTTGAAAAVADPVP